ncbi:hypothetical protein ABZ793_20760 [Micromonospora sp. NPDC047465]|uniref:hypothetical protein n=1 Tax=Micromonospora sp. NPDC047465 TaxID=3154813 RepID=UPI0033CF6717
MSRTASPAPAGVRLAPFAVVEVPLTVGVRQLPAEQSVTVTIDAPHGMLPDGPRQFAASATTTFDAVWRNVALASEGATATASGWWRQYVPSHVIDGSVVGVGSRWIFAAASLACSRRSRREHHLTWARMVAVLDGHRWGAALLSTRILAG